MLGFGAGQSLPVVAARLGLSAPLLTVTMCGASGGPETAEATSSATMSASVSGVVPVGPVVSTSTAGAHRRSGIGGWAGCPDGTAGCRRTVGSLRVDRPGRKSRVRSLRRRTGCGGCPVGCRTGWCPPRCPQVPRRPLRCWSDHDRSSRPRLSGRGCRFRPRHRESGPAAGSIQSLRALPAEPTDGPAATGSAPLECR